MSTSLRSSRADSPHAFEVSDRISRLVASDPEDLSFSIVVLGGADANRSSRNQCGICYTYYIAHVKNAFAFLGDGMSRIESLEPVVHGRGRKKESLDETYLGVHEELLYACKTKLVEGAQWTGIVTTIAIEMLKTGMVEVVICVQSDPDDRFSPRPVLARFVKFQKDGYAKIWVMSRYNDADSV
ncbi:hypothetical protein Q3G72_007315 [Acer saccharum]|nr:hypothetical protein Q3G72_007315 [Acer saccharum]